MEQRRSCGGCIYWSTNHKEHEKCKKCGDGRNNFVPRDMQCPVPSCQAGMIYYAKTAQLECPDCGTWVCPFATEISDSKTVRDEFEKNLPCSRSKEISIVVIKTKGVKSSSKSKGSSKQGLMQKKTTGQIYKELAK